MVAPRISSSKSSSSVIPSSNDLKRKRSTNIEEAAKQDNVHTFGNDKDQTSLARSPRARIGWHRERCLMLIFNSFSLTDIQRILDLQQRPSGIPNGWHIGYCAQKDCEVRVEEDMTDTGWCGDHFSTETIPLPLHKVRQILIHELFERADSQSILKRIAEESNGVFLSRREIDEVLAVILKKPERENEERIAKRQRMLPKDTQGDRAHKDTSDKTIKNIKSIKKSKQHPPYIRSQLRKPLADTKVQLQASRARVKGVRNESQSVKNTTTRQPRDRFSRASHQQSTQRDSRHLDPKKYPQAVASNDLSTSSSGRKRKATDENEDSLAKRPRFDSKSSTNSLQPSSLETYFKTAKAQASLRGIRPRETYFKSARTQASLLKAQVSSRSTPRNKKRIPEFSKKKNRLPETAAEDRSNLSTSTSSIQSEGKPPQPNITSTNKNNRPQTPDQEPTKNKRGGRKRKIVPPLDFGPSSPMEDFVWP